MPDKAFAPFIASLALLVVFTWVVWKLFAHVPDWQQLKTITLTPDLSPVVLGHPELGQRPGARSADFQHVQLRYDRRAQVWMLANLAAQKKLAWKRAGDPSFGYLREWPLQQGDVLRLDAVTLAVQVVTPDQLQLENTANHQQALWREAWFGNRLGGGLQVAGVPNSDVCPSELGGDRLFTLGGQVPCMTRWKLEGLAHNTALIKRFGDTYWLLPQRPEVVVQVLRAGQKIDLMQMEVPLPRTESGGYELIAGYTRYALHIADNRSLTLNPIANIHLFSNIPEHPGYARWGKATQALPWSWQSLWPGSVWASGLLFMAFLSLVWAVLAAQTQYHLRQAVKLKSTAIILLFPVLLLWFGVIWRNTSLPLSLTLAGLAGLVLSLLLFYQTKRGWPSGWIGFLVLFLAGFGLAAQLQLALGAANTQWHGYVGKQILASLFIAWLMTGVLVLPRGAAVQIWRALSIDAYGRIRAGWAWGIPGLVIAGLLILFVAGGEGGVGGFQPAELAKFSLGVLLAEAAMTVGDLNTHFKQNFAAKRDNPRAWFWLWARLLGWLALMAGVVAVVLSSVSDYSPLVVLVVLGFAFVWKTAPGLPRAWRWLVRGSPLLLLGLGVAVWHSPQTFAGLPQGERFMLWANPWFDPDLGLQIQRSLQAVHQSSWLGGEWGGANRNIMGIPALQDDFILAFVLYRFGLLAGLLLLFAQLCWAGMLFKLSDQLLIAPDRERNAYLARQFLAWLLYGLAWLQITHWVISWGNVLGLLPIMGQPMTWLSSGNSHLLALALPAVLLALLAAGHLQDSSGDV